MRPRTELGIALGAVLLLGILAAVLGSGGPPADEDLRRSTYLTGRLGARGYADALGLLGVRVDRIRHRVRSLPAADTSVGGTVFVALDPSADLSPLDGMHLSRFADSGGGLLLAGPGAAAAMACYRYSVVDAPATRAVIGDDTLRIGAVLQVTPDSARRGRSLLDDGGDVQCGPVPVSHVDTLLTSTSGMPVALWLLLDSGSTVTLVSDGVLFSNRLLRETDAGEFALGLVVGKYEHALIDEYHHGFGPSGGMLAAARSWSVSSPLGWAFWQLAIVSLLALAVAAVRFGPARRVVERRRRSSLEHVRALATALAAARGHDVAIGLLVRGLRRRLARPGEPLRGEPHARLAALESLTCGPPGADRVRRAALAVEDVWQDLKP